MKIYFTGVIITLIAHYILNFKYKWVTRTKLSDDSITAAFWESNRDKACKYFYSGIFLAFIWPFYILGLICMYSYPYVESLISKGFKLIYKIIPE